MANNDRKKTAKNADKLQEDGKWLNVSNLLLNFDYYRK
jgi:hypothetical protein